MSRIVFCSARCTSKVTRNNHKYQPAGSEESGKNGRKVCVCATTGGPAVRYYNLKSPYEYPLNTTARMFPFSHCLPDSTLLAASNERLSLMNLGHVLVKTRYLMLISESSKTESVKISGISPQ